MNTITKETQSKYRMSWAQGEASTVSAFTRDQYGCGEELHAKRASRDPFSLGAHPAAHCPEMAALMAFCGPELYAERQPLPWQEPPIRTHKFIPVN